MKEMCFFVSIGTTNPMVTIVLVLYDKQWHAEEDTTYLTETSLRLYLEELAKLQNGKANIKKEWEAQAWAYVGHRMLSFRNRPTISGENRGIQTRNSNRKKVEVVVQ